MCRQECTSHRARQTVRQKRIWLWQKKVSFINDGYIIYIKLVALKKKEWYKEQILKPRILPISVGAVGVGMRSLASCGFQQYSVPTPFVFSHKLISCLLLLWHLKLIQLWKSIILQQCFGKHSCYMSWDTLLCWTEGNHLAEYARKDQQIHFITRPYIMSETLENNDSNDRTFSCNLSLLVVSRFRNLFLYTEFYIISVFS